MSKTHGNGTTVYEAALAELREVTHNDQHRRKIEQSIVHEARGHDDWILHTALTAIDTSHGDIVETVETFHRDVQGRTDSLTRRVEQAEGALNSAVDNFRSEVNKSFEKTWETVAQKFDKTWESVGHNFDATNERTQREVSDLRDELTKILDKRFTHIDQTFASLRADIEVVKALQMELIKERIGRPELLKR
ncbi:MAG TPA: hypothetical protein VM681_11045 [Candidatus Thermoplasmatota archaeon]|nr:hypothetical protein [Candidatus Thermoplasmatota archaeon]